MLNVCEENYKSTGYNVFNQVFTLSQAIMKFIINFPFKLNILGIQELVYASHCSRCLSYKAFSVLTILDLPLNPFEHPKTPKGQCGLWWLSQVSKLGKLL